MRNCFGGRSQGSIWRQLLLPIGFFALIFTVFLIALQQMSLSVASEQLKSTEQGIRRAVVHCYAVEGRYPTSLQYLEEHYGLLIDKERFAVHYEPIAANLMPNITVFPLSELTEGFVPEGADPFAIKDENTSLPGVDYAGLLEEDAV